MPIPTYDQFIDPLLRYLAMHPEGARTGDVYEALADEIRFSEEEREELLPSGSQAVYKNRIGWAQDRLKRAGLSESPKRGVWKLTPHGAAFVGQTKFPLRAEQLIKITTVVPGSTAHPEMGLPLPTVQPSNTESPDERLNSAIDEINEAVCACPPSLTSQLWRMIGHELEHELEHPPKPYAEADNRHTNIAGRADLQRVGGSGDAGIDGVISLDRLGRDMIIRRSLSAKADKRLRRSNFVGRPVNSNIRRSLVRRRISDILARPPLFWRFL